MSLIDTIKAITIIKGSSDFVNKQEEIKNKVRKMIQALQKASVFLAEKRAVIDRYITLAEIVITRLKEFLKK